MTGPVLPASGNARVCAAVSLGWQMAKLFHSPVHTGAAGDPRRDDRLPGISGFPAATRSKWLAEQVDATATVLLPMRSGAVTDALGAVIGQLGDDRRNRDATLAAVLATAGVIVTVVLLHSVSPTARLVTGLAWVGGTLAAAYKASGSLLGSAVKGAEGWLWQTELDESVATVATRLPAPAAHRRVTGGEVGKMSFSPGKLFAADGAPSAT